MLFRSLIGRFALGRHWNDAADEQRQTYLAVFSAFLVKTYSDRLGGVAIDDFRVIDAEVMKEKDILVHSEVIQGREPPVRAVWRLRERDGRFRILDLTVEGISLALLLRQEFASVLRSRGGVDGLIAMLREKTN